MLLFSKKIFLKKKLRVFFLIQLSLITLLIFFLLNLVNGTTRNYYLEQITKLKINPIRRVLFR